MAQITMRDVADYANVSLSTVSRVLNNHPSVDEQLRQRVLDAVRSLGYQPNQAARRLRSNTSNVIGLIISDIENPFFTSVVRGVEDLAYAHQRNVILCNTDEDPAKEQIYLEVMQAERVAGLIITPTYGERRHDSFARLQALGIPIVLLDRSLSGSEFDDVTVDNLSGAYQAVKHLLQLGRKRIAMVTAETRLTTFQQRHQGYLKALAEFGIKPQKELVKVTDPKTAAAQQVTAQLLQLSRPPDAIFAANNLMTIGVLNTLREQRVRVPEDVALVGFDDMPWSGQLSPPVTSVSQPTYELGREAARLLLRRINDPDVHPQSIVLQTRLVVRESCGAQLGKEA